MTVRILFVGLLLCLLPGRTQGQHGLVGTYYNGTNFEHKILTRIDPQVNFDWTNRSPAAGIGKSYYSIRWTGTLVAPVSGKYIFSANVDDGIRVWIGNRKIIDAWSLHDSDRFRGTVILEAGKFYDIRVDYFNDMLGGIIELLWHRPDETATSTPLRDAAGKPVSDPTVYQPITAQYLYRKRPVPPPGAVVLPKPAVVAKPQVRPKPTRIVQLPKPVLVAISPVVLPASRNEKPTPEPAQSVRVLNTTGIRTLLFGQSTYTVLPASMAQLDTVVQILQQHPTLRVDIVGHTDNVGDSRLNQTLSEQRAKIVASYLIRRGIADERITTEGFGSKLPLGDNTTESERSKNRRVAITIR